ncbi:hypothetical protein [Legionella sp. CNM-4043-24]|uniref:hypothetical protein n=1 Tax=Legionella sp. CNM-4043-24 TaxID=3421646 RepID=UPI00403B31D3
MPITTEQRNQFVTDIRNNNYAFIPGIVGNEDAINDYNHARNQLLDYLTSDGRSNTDKILAIHRFHHQQRQALINIYLNATRNTETAQEATERQRFVDIKASTRTILKAGRLFHTWSSTILPLSTLNDQPSVISRDLSAEQPSLAMTYEAAFGAVPANEEELISAGRGIPLHPRLQGEMLDPKHRAWGTGYASTRYALQPVNDGWANASPRTEDLTVHIEFNDLLRARDQSFDPSVDRENLDPNSPQFFNSFNHYLTQTELLNYLLTARNGRLHKGTEENPIQNTGQEPHIFTMDMQGNLYTNRDGEYRNGRRIGHPSFTRGEALAGAGELKIVAGKVTQISNQSGHYVPGPLSLHRVLVELETRGVLAPNCRVIILPPPMQEGYFSGTVEEFKAQYPMPDDIQNPPDLSEKANPARLLESLREINNYLKQRGRETSGFLSFFNQFNGRDFHQRSTHFKTLMDTMVAGNVGDVVAFINNSLPQFQHGRRTSYANLLIAVRDALTEGSLLANPLVRENLNDYSKVYDSLNQHIQAQRQYREKSFFESKRNERGAVAESYLQYKFWRKDVSEERRSEFDKADTAAEMAELNAKNW